MAKIDTYSAKGTKGQSMTVPNELFGQKENKELLAQAIHVYRSRLHLGTSKVQTRGEVSLTTKKWFRQKGTGRARHGAQSAPIFVGGGKAHGPKGVKRQLSLPKNMRRKALGLALSTKLIDKKVLVISGVSALTKTKDAQKLLDKVGKSQKRFTLVLSKDSKEAVRAFQNISNVKIVFFDNLNAYQVYLGGMILVDKEAIK